MRRPPAASNETRFKVRVTPGAAADRVGGEWTGPHGERRLIVRVAARAHDGQANAAVVKLLARALGLRAADLRILAGAGSRNKTIAAVGDCSSGLGALADLKNREF